MNITMLSDDGFRAPANGFHVLTYAEEGFAPLNIHADPHGLSKEVLVGFAHQVNSRNESGTLHPAAPISAVPRVLIRGTSDRAALSAAIKDFLSTNQQTIHAKRVLCDFRTPRIAPYVISAIKDAMQSPEAHGIDEVVILTPEPRRELGQTH